MPAREREREGERERERYEKKKKNEEVMSVSAFLLPVGVVGVIVKETKER